MIRSISNKVLFSFSTKSYYAFEQISFICFSPTKPFLSFSTQSHYAFEQIPFICFSRYLQVGYYFSNKFQQNLTSLLNKFPLTCFSRWLPFFKQIPTKSYYFERIPFDMLLKIFSSWLPFFKREDHFKF